MDKSKSEIITFKVDESLAEALKGIDNRSEFIRNAVTAALGAVCPLCQGSGILSPKQKEHWDDFAADHSVKECKQCHELYLACGGSNRREHRH